MAVEIAARERQGLPDADEWRPVFPRGWHPCRDCGHGIQRQARRCAICEVERSGRPVLSPELISASLRLGELWAPVIPPCPPSAPRRKLPNADRNARRAADRAKARA